jgi:hypothetical protein
MNYEELIIAVVSAIVGFIVRALKPKKNGASPQP